MDEEIKVSSVEKTALKVEEKKYLKMGVGEVLGDSGGVVNSLDVCLESLKSVGCFYFRHILSSQWKAVTVNLPTLKAYLEACSHNVSGNKQ